MYNLRAPSEGGGGGTRQQLSKHVKQATDVLKIDCSVAAKIDASLSIMEITT